MAIAAGVALLLIVGVALAAGQLGGDDGNGTTSTTPATGETEVEEFSAADKEDWVTQCVADGSGVAFCQCSYDSISEEIPFDEYQRNVDEFGGDLDSYPLRFQTIFDNCEESTGG